MMADLNIFYTSQSRYETATCGYCAARVVIDMDDLQGNVNANPNDHEDDCPRALMADPR